MRTPRPWRLEVDTSPWIVRPDGRPIAKFYEKDDAIFCFRAVNNFEELLAAAMKTRDFLKGWRAVSPNHIDLLSRIEDAIAKAKEAP